MVILCNTHDSCYKKQKQNKIVECKILYTQKSNMTVFSPSSLNFLDHFQPGFSLPTFHCSNEIDQPNNLGFSVFLEEKCVVALLRDRLKQVKVC